MEHFSPWNTHTHSLSLLNGQTNCSNNYIYSFHSCFLFHWSRNYAIKFGDIYLHSWSFLTQNEAVLILKSSSGYKRNKHMLLTHAWLHPRFLGRKSSKPIMFIYFYVAMHWHVCFCSTLYRKTDDLLSFIYTLIIWVSFLLQTALCYYTQVLNDAVVGR